MRLVQTKRRGGLIFLGVGAAGAGWAELSIHAQKSGLTRGCCCISGSILLPVFCGTEGFSACSREFWVLMYHWYSRGGKQDLKGVRGGEERVTPTEKCLCCHSILSGSLCALCHQDSLSSHPSHTQSKDSVPEGTFCNLWSLQDGKKPMGLLLEASVVLHPFVAP